MARIPVINATPNLERGSVLQYPSGSPVGGALQGLGGSLQQAGARLRAQNEQMEAEQRQKLEAKAAEARRIQDQEDTFQANVIENQTTLAVQSLLEESAKEIPANGAGFHDMVAGQLDPVTGAALKPGKFDDVWKRMLEQVPESKRAQFAAQEPLYRMRASQAAARLEYTQKQANYETTWAGFRDQFGQGIAENATSSDTVELFREQGRKAIQATDLPPLRKTELLREWNQQSAEIYATARMAQDPAFAGSARQQLGLAPDQPATSSDASIVDRIIQVESGGKANAKNPNSSATGLGQFTSGTWMQIVRKYEPDLAAGKSRAEVLALRNNGTVSRRMVGHLIQENTDAMRRAGVPVNDGTTYLAHFAGSGGAIRLLKANPGASVESVLGSDAVNANSFLRGKTASDVIAWAAKKVGSAAPSSAGQGSGEPADPILADIPFDRRTVLANQADVLVNETQATEKAQITAAYTAYKDAAELDVVSGKIMDESIILADPTLTDGDKATLVRTVRAQNEATAQLRSDLQTFTAGNLLLNPVDTNDKARGNKLYDDLVKRVPEDQLPAVTAEFIRQTNVVPNSVAADIRNGMSSKDPTVAAASLVDAANLYKRTPTAVDNMDGGSEIRDAAQAFEHLTNYRGMSPFDAAKKIIEDNSPEAIRVKEALKPAADALVKEITPDHVTGLYDIPWSMSSPEAGFTPALGAAMTADYKELLREKFVGPAHGDADLAKSMAERDLKQRYDITYVNGTPTLMMFPPEKFYGPAGVTSEQLKQKALEAAQEEADGAEVVDFFLTTVPNTVRDVSAGRLPRYELRYATEENGQEVWHQVIGSGFGLGVADIQALKRGTPEDPSIQVIQQQAEEARKAAIRERASDRIDRQETRQMNLTPEQRALQERSAPSLPPPPQVDFPEPRKTISEGAAPGPSALPTVDAMGNQTGF
jgi:hypothetical protein